MPVRGISLEDSGTITPSRRNNTNFPRSLETPGTLIGELTKKNTPLAEFNMDPLLLYHTAKITTLLFPWGMENEFGYAKMCLEGRERLFSLALSFPDSQADTSKS